MAHITINDTTPRDQYTATGGQTEFTVSYPFFTDASLLVYQTAAAATFNASTDLLTLSTHYTVTGAGNVEGATKKITLVTGATANDVITIIRSEPLARSSDYQDSGDLLAETLNDEQDLVIMLSQQLREEIQRALRVSTFSGADVDLPEPVAGTFLAWDSAGTAIEFVASPVGGVVTDGSITTAKLADDAVTALKLADDAVDTAAILDDAVTTAKIIDAAVTNDKRTYPTTVTGHTRAGNTQIFNGDDAAALTSFNVVGLVTENTFETVGPTGSGATNIWTALDNMPASATIVIVDVNLEVGTSGTGLGNISMSATSGDIASPSSGNEENLVARMAVDHDAAITGVTGNMTRVFIALGATNQDFKVTWGATGDSNPNCTIYYRGFMTE